MARVFSDNKAEAALGKDRDQISPDFQNFSRPTCNLLQYEAFPIVQAPLEQMIGDCSAAFLDWNLNCSDTAGAAQQYVGHLFNLEMS